MNAFLLEYYNTITFSIESLAAFTGLLLYKKYKQTAAKYFIWFLVYLSVCDLSNTYVHYIKDGFLSFLEGTVFIKNFWWATLYWKIGAIMFFSFYYNSILTNEKFKRIVKYSSYSFLVFSIIYILFNWDDYFNLFFPIISILGAIIIFLCTAFYFFEILSSEKILTFYKSINFYISAAIFIWWLIITPLVFYDIYNSHYDWNFIFLKWQIYLFANIVMYLTFTFALIFCKPEADKQ
ncbi:hypothetical protein CJ739_3647 [Mariniflexile rhizosphaerae]|uniref:hypothetical protein n=1 Tax=unclassified Mariniflexile TaxID=2643887 RepID=UPI000CC8F4D1|nr:hypothetical protein [Mariniflexile sp. TRM1-10]AXP82709.1 hypothetical protein CJ739_3647 [Mariniflexile sp. TRM1-10]PLB18887.1 MAG: putative membrane protein [Flavobacteriaceae bacterium FS1-H7996/R]